jgi:microcystin degradation protein MlrC
MRMFVASLLTETNTFSPLPVDRSAFERAFYAPPGKHPETPTLCSAGRRRAQPREVGRDHAHRRTATWSEPAGLVSRGAYESLRDEILGQLRAPCRSTSRCSACTAPWSRTAMTTPRAICSPGRARSSARRRSSAPNHDMHCHMTEKRIAAANISILFKEFPHTDFAARAEELVDIAIRAARGRSVPSQPCSTAARSITRS